LDALVDTQERTTQLVLFFKALADENRLRIVGLLADKPCSVEELAAMLQLSSATVSHHLQRLVAADLVEARALQYYNVYGLRHGTLLEMAKQLERVDVLKETTRELDLNRYANKVLDDYIVRGRLKTIPRQLKKRQVVLNRLAKEFEFGKRYSERQVNEMLKAFHADFATLRRELVNNKLLARDRQYYWKVPTSEGQSAREPSPAVMGRDSRNKPATVK
jgi:biotin operon repressor